MKSDLVVAAAVYSSDNLQTVFLEGLFSYLFSIGSI